jgi:hypothetical protein
MFYQFHACYQFQLIVGLLGSHKLVLLLLVAVVRGEHAVTVTSPRQRGFACSGWSIGPQMAH